MPCPRCGAAAAFDPGNRWRPFCSERCRLIDLGQWAAEQYRVPQAERAPDEPETRDASGGRSGEPHA